MRRGSKLLVGSLFAGLVTLHGTRADAQVTGGQVDTFTGGELHGWHVGSPPQSPHPAPPQVVATGGPGGAGDAWLRLTSLGPTVEAGSRLSVLNLTRWRGDYLAAGITGIGMDVQNLGTTDVFLRLLVADFPDQPGPPLAAAWSADAVRVAANTGWTRIFFPILPGAMVVPFGTYAGALANVDELRLFHNPAPVFAGPPNSSPPIAATIGIDNITAAVVPEPSSLALLGTGLLTIGGVALRGWNARRRA